MNKFLGITAAVAVVLIAGYFFVNAGDQELSVKEEVKSEVNNQTTEAMDIENSNYSINTEQSLVNWEAAKIIGHGHTGEVKFKEGAAVIENGKVKNVTLKVDMTTIKDNDGSEALETHLKSDDFFSVENFQEAEFVLTQIENDMAKGALTIKGITNEIEVPFNVSEVDGNFVVNSEFQIDRTLWDIRFGSGKFFENLGDKTIKDEINFSVKVVATKA